MNKKIVVNTVGRLMIVEAGLLILPALIALYFHEYKQLSSFLITAFSSAVLGLSLNFLFKPQKTVIYAKEGFTIVALAWLCISAIGAVPFTLSKEIPSYIDAFFETVSGFTTTGASILTDVQKMSKSILFWRSFTHWVGGMGVLVFVMALIPNFSDRSIHLLRAEVPGPVVGKLVPKIKDTAKILYLIYIGFTVAEILLLYFVGGMRLFDSVVHTFGTAGTGGFGIKATGIGGYNKYCQWIIAIFMLIFGVNFNLYYLILIRKIRTALKSQELWFYGSIVVVVSAVIALNIRNLYSGFEETIRTAVFQVASIMTTTGYATTDFNLWPDLSKGLLLVLMLLGACAGSTAGGLKLSRVIMLLKMIKREIKRMLHPRSVTKIRFEGKNMDEDTVRSVAVYFAFYCVSLILTFVLVCWEPFGIETNISAAISCFNNIGPAFGSAGPMSNYAAYSNFSKIILSVSMLMGRLEIFPLIIAFSPSTWLKK